jgi:hypothetical protein
MLNDLLAAIRNWRRKRRWNASLQMYHLRITVQQDARWLAHDPVASALCERYAAMLADDWESRSSEDISRFRSRLGLEPTRKRVQMPAVHQGGNS